MITKSRTKPIIIPMLQALLPRIPKTFPKHSKIEEKLRRYESGYKGEVSIEYHLGFLPEKEIFILHDLWLKDRKGQLFQIDTLIITPSVILILDVKNHAGTLIIDPNIHQMIQKYKDNDDKVYDDPVLQGIQHEQQLKEFLATHHFPPIPIISLVAFSHPTAIIKLTTNNPQYTKRIIRSAAIPEKFNSITQSFKNPMYSKKDCNKLSRVLIKNHSPKQWDVLSMFNIDISEIIPGVSCPKCFAIPMRYNRGYWTCLNLECGYKSADAYIPTLNNFVLLYGNEMTNRGLRWILQIDSPSVIQKLAKKLGLKYTGNYKNRVYFIPYPLTVTNIKVDEE